MPVKWAARPGASRVAIGRPAGWPGGSERELSAWRRPAGSRGAAPVIGSWHCLPESELSSAALAEYAEDGFTDFQTLDRSADRWRPYSAAGNRRALDLCAAVGLRCFVVDGRIYRGERPYRPEAAPGQADVDA